MNRLPGNKTTGTIIITVCLIMLAYSVYRDFRFGKDFVGDLRNRVAGARLIRDGKSPYFYKWKTTDGIRYYDPHNFNDLKVSNITASPLFLQLFDPAAELPQWKINGLWCMIQYLMLLAMTTMAFLLAGTDRQRWATLIISILFLFTDAWKLHIMWGQNYICIPFLAMIIYFVLKKGSNAFWISFAGLASIVLVLIRPNALIFFIPLIFFRRKYSRYELLAFFIPVLLLSGWTIGNKEERFLWQDYGRAFGEHVKFHQKLHPATQSNIPDPGYAEWEGINRKAQEAYYENPPIIIYPENGNFFYLVNIIFHWKIPVNVLQTALLVIILSLTGIYYHLNGKAGNFDLAHAVLLGYGLYMIADIFSPIFRTQYYTVQFIFPLLVAASIYQPYARLTFFLLLAGILLNISKIPFIKMEHTIGEYLIICVIILFSLTKGQKTAIDPKTIE